MSQVIFIPVETDPSETRVAATPETVKKLIGYGFKIIVESGAGIASRITDQAFADAGAQIGKTADIKTADIILKLRRPSSAELKNYKTGAVLIAMLDPYGHEDSVAAIAQAGLTAFTMEFMPRITRAQVMDVLSSQANLAATLDQLSSTLIPEKDGGVLSRVGVVDYTIGKGVAPGVFVVADMSHPRISERMEDLKMGKGPYFTFHRPYHLTSLEVPLTCARAVLYGKADMVPLSKPTAEVAAVAKKDMAAGETLDAIGEYCYRAWIMTAGEARAAKAIPCGMLTGAKVLKPIKKGELITYDNAALPAGSRLAELRARQDKLVYGI